MNNIEFKRLLEEASQAKDMKSNPLFIDTHKAKQAIEYVLHEKSEESEHFLEQDREILKAFFENNLLHILSADKVIYSENDITINDVTWPRDIGENITKTKETINIIFTKSDIQKLKEFFPADFSLGKYLEIFFPGLKKQNYYHIEGGEIYDMAHNRFTKGVSHNLDIKGENLNKGFGKRSEQYGPTLAIDITNGAEVLDEKIIELAITQVETHEVTSGELQILSTSNLIKDAKVVLTSGENNFVVNLFIEKDGKYIQAYNPYGQRIMPFDYDGNGPGKSLLSPYIHGWRENFTALGDAKKYYSNLCNGSVQLQLKKVDSLAGILHVIGTE